MAEGDQPVSHTPEPPRRFIGPLLERGWFAVCVGGATAYCVFAAFQLGATYDEYFYVHAGMLRWRTGSHSALLAGGTMPLPVDVQTLPIFLYEQLVYEGRTGTTFHTPGDLDIILPYARLGNLVFLWIALLYARLIGRHLGGVLAGALAVTLLVLEPNILASASLATTDLAITTCLLALGYHYARGLESTGWGKRVIVPGVCFGIAILAKASAIVFGPVCLLVIALSGRAAVSNAGDTRWQAARSFVRRALPELGAIVAIGAALAYAYCTTDGGMHAVAAIRFQIEHYATGHAAYLFGRAASDFWYFFPAVLTVKCTLAALAAAVVVLLVDRRSLISWPTLTFVVLLLLSVRFRVQIGIRIILPLLAFGAVGLAVALARTHRQLPVGARHVLVAALVASFGWTAVTIARQHPNALCYTNELWGSTANGYRHVSDANYDWGQGLPQLRRWHEEHPVKLMVWYFGSDPLESELPRMTFVQLRNLGLISPAAFHAVVDGHHLAVSTTYLYGAYSGGAESVVAYLRTKVPSARTPTFLIYDFSGASESSTSRGERRVP